VIFTDSENRDWDVIDFKLSKPPKDTKKRVPIGSPDAAGRAFYRPGEVRLYWFGAVAYRDTSQRTLENQFAIAKPSTVSPAEQHWSK
jgi:hypothetical protein